MTMYHHLLSAQAAQPNAAPSPLSSSLRAIADWIAIAVNYYTAAAVYEQLSRLPDAELQRRGLSRATLAWDISQACDRANV
jgi:hypothetical protein